jgi:hypothetical protein
LRSILFPNGRVTWRTALGCRAAGRPQAELALFLQEFQDCVEELEAVFLEQTKWVASGTKRALLHRRVNKIAHQAFAILGVRPRVVLNAERFASDRRVACPVTLVLDLFAQPIPAGLAWTK